MHADEDEDEEEDEEEAGSGRGRRMRMSIGNAEADAHFFSGTTLCPSSPLGLHNTIVHTVRERGRKGERVCVREREGDRRHT